MKRKKLVPKQQRKGLTKKGRRISRPRATTRKFIRPQNAKQYFTLSESAQDTWNRISQVPSLMRSKGLSLSQAAKALGVDRRAVVNRAGPAIRKLKNGRYVAKPKDRLLRVLNIPGPEGLQKVLVRDSQTASVLGEYDEAVRRYVYTGDDSKLRKFRRVRLFDADKNRIKLLLDKAELVRLGSAGQLSFESFYARVA